VTDQAWHSPAQDGNAQGERALSFGAVAENYNRYRPSPAPAAIDWLVPAHCQVAVDLAAGTGLLSRALTRKVPQVIAVEPDERMAAVLDVQSPGIRVLRGTGEAIPLPDACVDALFVSSAWHWLDPERASAEIARVLRDGGRFGVLWSSRDEGADWFRELRSRAAPEYRSEPGEHLPRRSHRDVPLPAGSAFSDIQTESFPFTRTMSTPDVLGLLATYSSSITAPPQEQARQRERAVALLDEYFPGADTIELPMRTWCWRATREPRTQATRSTQPTQRAQQAQPAPPVSTAPEPDLATPAWVTQARSQFSALDGSFVFLDAPGGTQTPDAVGAAVARLYREASGNLDAPYPASQRLNALVADARSAAAGFLGGTPDEIIFGASMTALNYTLTRTLGRTLRPGDEILVTRLDHDANVAPWLDLASDLGLTVRLAGVRPDTTLDLDELAGLLSDRTAVVAFPWSANTTGTITDARAVCALAHEAGALAWVDAVQYAPHEPVDVAGIGADVLLCSAYKFCGPHLGIAYGRRELLESWRPYKVRPASDQPAGHRFETGTLPYELLAALLAAFGYLDSLGGWDQVRAWERRLGERLLAGLPPSARLHGLPTMTGRGPTFLVSFPGHQAAALSTGLAEAGFGVWSGHDFYAPGLYEQLAWGDALRIGLAHYNTLDEVDRFTAALASLTGAG
jgi:cysteine desulfurase family protein (TIGR01976 family)